MACEIRGKSEGDWISRGSQNDLEKRWCV